MIRYPRRGIGECEAGATAVEFALLAPVFLMILVAIIYLSFLAFNYVSLHYAVEDAARCGSIRNSSDCPDTTTTEAYAKGKFLGIGVTPTFVATAATCGSQVNGTGTFTWSTGVFNLSVPMTATACYP